jgi:hypothetical protein
MIKKYFFCLILTVIFTILNVKQTKAWSIDGCRILPADNVWNTKIDSTNQLISVHPNSSYYINNLTAAPGPIKGYHIEMAFPML